jgi:hypothetical protein
MWRFAFAAADAGRRRDHPEFVIEGSKGFSPNSYSAIVDGGLAQV